MKNQKRLFLLIFVWNLSLACASQGMQQKIDQQPQTNVEDFAAAVFNSLKNNDFNSYINLLPSPPFTIDLISIAQAKENLVFTKDSFLEYKSNSQYQFNQLIEQMRSEGIALNEMKLYNIIVEFGKEGKFKVINIYLVIKTLNSNKYRIRIEDCFKVGNKYFPESLKWYGQKEFTR
jgi:hypothetical protein